jgi:myosin heavy subunit
MTNWFEIKILGFSDEFLIEDFRNYRYLTHGNVPVPGQDDAELYKQLQDAMNIMGFTTEEQSGG